MRVWSSQLLTGWIIINNKLTCSLLQGNSILTLTLGRAGRSTVAAVLITPSLVPTTEQSGPRHTSTTTTTSTTTMAHNDPYAGIEFDDITESTGLAADEIKCLKVRPTF